jgi:hypothetical protein
MMLLVDIRATDAAGLFDTFNLTVTITPVNQPPTFSPAGCNVNVAEGQVINKYELRFVCAYALRIRNANVCELA